MEKNISTLNEKVKAQLEEIDARIEILKDNIELGAALERLHNDSDFQKVVLNGYLTSEAERLFGVLIEPSHIKRDVMQNMMDKMSAIRNFKQYFGTVLINANMAPEQLEGEEAYRKEVTADAAILSTPGSEK